MHPSPINRIPASAGKAPTALLLYLAPIALVLSLPTALIAQTSQRWFQIEISIFSNESFTDRSEELWQPGRNQLEYPNPMRRLDQLSDLLITDQMLADELGASSSQDGLAVETERPAVLDEEAQAAAERAERLAAIVATEPRLPRPPGDFRVFDLQRDPYVQLGPEQSDFQQTNRALERSPDHRLLFHGLWRESLADANAATPLYIQGGLLYGDQHELQGTITLRFNENRDRIVIDSNLWLTEFSVSADPNGEWRLPEIPASVQTPLDSLRQAQQSLQYGINRVFRMQQSREMRSTEFHYLDHPAMGIVILVEPYEPPPLPLPEFDFETSN